MGSRRRASETSPTARLPLPPCLRSGRREEESPHAAPPSPAPPPPASFGLRQPPHHPVSAALGQRLPGRPGGEKAGGESPGCGGGEAAAAASAAASEPPRLPEAAPAGSCQARGISSFSSPRVCLLPGSGGGSRRCRRRVMANPAVSTCEGTGLLPVTSGTGRAPGAEDTGWPRRPVSPLPAPPPDGSRRAAACSQHGLSPVPRLDLLPPLRRHRRRSRRTQGSWPVRCSALAEVGGGRGAAARRAFPGEARVERGRMEAAGRLRAPKDADPADPLLPSRQWG